MDKTIEQQIAELWSDKCPKCNSPAWIGAVNATCVSKSCPNGSEKEFERYAKLLSKQIDDLIEQTPNPTLDFVEDITIKGGTSTGRLIYGGSGIDEDDEDTQPGLAAPRTFKWFDDLDSKVELALRPFGKARVERCEYEDAFEVILYNPPTGLYLAEKFTVEFAEAGGEGFGDWLARHLALTFPPELNHAWDYKQVEGYFNDLIYDHLRTPPNHISTGMAFTLWYNDDTHLIQAGKGKTRALQIGQYVGEDNDFRVVAISRADDTFCIKRAA